MTGRLLHQPFALPKDEVGEVVMMQIFGIRDHSGFYTRHVSIG